MRSVNPAVIPQLVSYAKSVGVNVIWVNGGMAQFDSLSVAERKSLAQAWVSAAHAQGIYTIVHVGTTVLSDAQALAAHAASIGADAIATVPPYYQGVGSVQTLVDWLAAVASGAPSLPLFYYHIPGSTHVDFSMASLFAVAPQQVPTLAGVKFVSGDLGDYLTCVSLYGARFRFMFAPEPKLAGIPLGGDSVILAEDFFAPSWLRMSRAYAAGDLAAAQKEQLWKLDVANVFGGFGGGYAERYVYRQLLGVDLGPARLPGQPLSSGDVQNLFAQLEQLNFFNLTQPLGW